MASYNDDLFRIRGRVRNFRRAITESQVDQFINDRIRQAQNYKTTWSAMIKKGVLSMPAAYSVGTVSVATGSRIVTGVGCNFPVSDVINSTIPAGIQELGYQDFVPASPLGFTQDSIVYVDAADADVAEAVPIVQIVNPQTFNGQFCNPHNANCTITQSSLVNRQFRISYNYPIFTILAVIDSNTLLLDEPWGGAPLTGVAYYIVKLYYTFTPNTQELFWILDQNQGLPLNIHTSVRSANWSDPQRIDLGPQPTDVVDGHPSPNGIIQWEIWPPLNVAYQLQYAVYEYWNDLVRDTDRPPWFINPTMFYHGALADALRYKTNEKDPYQDLRTAEVYEQKFMSELEKAAEADESKVLRALAFPEKSMGYPSGANWDQSHDIDMFYGAF